MAFYSRAFGDPGSEPPAAPAPVAVPMLSPAGATLGLVPFAVAALFFWAILAPPPKVKTKFISRRG